MEEILFLGKDNWNNKQIVRAIPQNTFKEWKSDVYYEIKKDYSYCSSSEDDDTDDEVNNYDDTGFSVPSPPTVVPPAPSINDNTDIPPNIDVASRREFVPSFELKEILIRVESKIDNIPVHHSEEKLIELKGKIRECFRCVVCMDDCLDNITVCIKCNRLVGCQDCMRPLDCCPLCRGTFDDQPVVKIPGLELLLR